MLGHHHMKKDRFHYPYESKIGYLPHIKHDNHLNVKCNIKKNIENILTTSEHCQITYDAKNVNYIEIKILRI